jgi:hypothetical protein
MLLRAHATPALPRWPASAAPLASNVRQTPEICALQEAVEECEAVAVAADSKVAEVEVAQLAEAGADD